ncbi:hypothetical protein ACF8PL_26975 [Delftia sp. WSY_4]|uniref:hypothetical protein n=1 Tax=unclassified Delftia TaxID=2613839 RepID=UPI00370BF5C0
MTDRTMAHLYGGASIVLAVVSIILGWQAAADWREIGLYTSGWLSAFLSAFLLARVLRSGESQSLELNEVKQDIGVLKGLLEIKNEKIFSLKKELAHRNSTLDLIAAFHSLQPAKVREVVDANAPRATE